MEVLIVDDDKNVAEAVRLVLEGEGYAARLAHSVAAAKAALEAKRPDLCIFDVWMNGEDGLDLAAEVKAQTGLPLVIMSGGGPGRTLESVTAKADAVGAAAMLFKPFDDDELIGAVRKALGEAG